MANLTESFGDRLRQTPIGIMMIAALLTILGVGSLAGGGYLLLEREAVSLWGVAAGLIGGAAILYLTYNLVQLVRWTWMTLVVLLALMTVSSVLRLFVVPEIAIAPIAELLIEAVAAYYLTRPSIRRRFGRTR